MAQTTNPQQGALTITYGAVEATYPIIDYLGNSSSTIQTDIDDTLAIKVNIDNEEKITTTTQEKQDDSNESFTAANEAVNEANEAINEAVIMLQFLCSEDNSIPHK